jgi:hypothetical protein
MQSLKAWATRRLRRDGFIGPRRQPWTSHGSTEYLWGPENLARAVDYDVRRQDLKGG